MKPQVHTRYDVIVIGGGASGLMAAGKAANEGKTVLILEKNSELGKKLAITGGGRCNITNATFNPHEFLANFGDAGKYLHSPLSQFGVQDTFDFFENRGLPLVVQARKRAFPHTEKASDVSKVMVAYAKHKNITVMTKSPVLQIMFDQNKRLITGARTANGVFTAKSYIVSAGGASHPATGSTGDAFVWLKKLGHNIQASTPNIVPLQTVDEWGHKLSGVSLSFMKITFFCNQTKAFSKKGKLLFTHFGLSSPLILNSASQVSKLLQKGQVTAKVDCYPDTDIGALEKKFLAIFDEHKNKLFKNIVDILTPNGFSDIFSDFSGTPSPDTKVHSITKAERKRMVALLKALPLHIKGLMGMDWAVISDGGVPLNEVDTKTMQSKKVANLWLTGDILHVNRPSGGYSLQLAWTSGWVAGLTC